MFYFKAHDLYLPIIFLVFEFKSHPVDLLIRLFLKPLVIDKPDLIIIGIAHAFIVNISITVNINL